MRTRTAPSTLALAAAMLLLVVLTAPAAALANGGWIEESYEGSASCDFDGDGIHSVYETVEGQTAPTQAAWTEDGQGVTHVNVIQRLGNIEYFAAGATPEYVYFTGDVHISGVWDFDNDTFPLDGMVRVRTTVTDAGGNVLASLRMIAKTHDGVYEPLHLTGGPCAP